MQNQVELYQKVIPLAGLGIWACDLPDGQIYWNSVMRDIYEVDTDYQPLIENSIAFYKHPDSVTDIIKQIIATGKDDTHVFEITTAKGTPKWIKVKMSAAFKDGVCTQIFGTLEDITEEVKLKQELEDREKRFYQAFDYAPIGMALVSPTGQWIKVNHSLRQLMGYDETEFLKRTFQDYTHPEDLDADLQQMHQLLNGEISSYSMEKRYLHRDGHLIWALLSVTLVRNTHNKPHYFISQIRDITERKKSMDTIREQNARLLNFAHIVSHNLRSHTGNLQMLTDMLTHEKDETEKQKIIDMLVVNAANLQETLLHLNEVVQVQNSAQTKKPLNLNNEIKRVLKILNGSVRLSNAQVKVDIDKSLKIRYNPAYLESILVNLVSNSIKYRSSKRPVEIHISAVKTPSGTVLKFTDNGSGMDLELHGHKIFGMYKTFHGNADARGIGLFLVKNQVEAMGGTVTAESRPDAGMTFTIKIIN